MISKLNFQNPLLQSSEIILIFWFSDQKTFNIIIIIMLKTAEYNISGFFE